MAITAAQVKELRERTGLGMMDCKKALQEADGNMDEAIKVLRERGAIKAAKREGRKAAEGLVAVASSPDSKESVAVQLNSETDFVARNPEFAETAASIAAAALSAGASAIDKIAEAALGEGKTVAAAVEELRGKIGEKIELGSCAAVSGDVTAAYKHFNGKIAVLVAASAPGLSEDKKGEVIDGLRNIAMHVAANNPPFLNADSVDAKTLEDEKAIYATQAKNEGKPENIIPRIVEGKVKAFYKQNCLVEQPFAMDQDKTIGQVAQETGKGAGVELTLTDFKRIEVGADAKKASEDEAE